MAVNGIMPLGTVAGVRQFFPNAAGIRSSETVMQSPSAGSASETLRAGLQDRVQTPAPGRQTALQGSVPRLAGANFAIGRHSAATAGPATTAGSRAASAEPGQTAAASSGKSPPPVQSNVGMVLYDLQSGIRKAEALLQSVSSSVPGAANRVLAAKAYSLEIQAQQEIARLQTEAGRPAREWYA